MLTKPFIIRGNNWAEQSVVKVSYGSKFVIVKCKSQPGYLKTMENDLNAFMRGGVNREHGLYFHLYNFVKKNPNLVFKVETILESADGYLLLKAEQEQLDLHRNNKHFLNNQVNAYIPRYNEETQMYGWLTKNSVLNFQKWMKTSRVRPKRKSAV